jgi:peptidoglycan/LPS O-acetylase OafA/YrhL
VKEKVRLTELDLLRFLAALSVVLYHRIWTDPAFPQWLTNVTQMGYLGVHLFFMISGFVILWTAMGRTPWQFLASRISRLYPAFLAGLAITSLLIWIIREGVSGSQLLANATMFPTLFHAEDVDPVYWTLTTEWKFYAIILGLIALKQIKHMDVWLWGWLAVSFAALFLPANFLLKQATLSGYSSLFILGCVGCLIRSKSGPARIALYAAAMTLSVWHAYTEAPVQSVSAAIVVALAAILFLALVCQKLTLPAWKGWYWLGALTYPVYLLHYKAMDVLAQVSPWNSVTTQLVLICLAFAGAFVMVLTIERKVSPVVQRLLTVRTPVLATA